MIPHPGDTLTIACQVISNAGTVTFNAGDKVTVRDVDVMPAYHLYKIWMPATVKTLRLVGVTGCWKPETFVELKSK